MEDGLRMLVDHFISHTETTTVLVARENKNAPVLQKLNVIIVASDQPNPLQMMHFTICDEETAVYIIDESRFTDELIDDKNTKLSKLINEGEIIFDRNRFMERYKSEMEQMPFFHSNLRIGLEFAELIHHYTDGKQYFHSRQYVDAFNKIVLLMNKLAELIIMQEGFPADKVIWSQFRDAHLEIGKLYEELTVNEEHISKRLELIFLAIDFHIYSQAGRGAAHFLLIMEEKEQWQYGEIAAHPQLVMYRRELSVLLSYLIEKDFVQKKRIATQVPDVYEYLYQLKKPLDAF